MNNYRDYKIKPENSVITKYRTSKMLSLILACCLIASIYCNAALAAVALWQYQDSLKSEIQETQQQISELTPTEEPLAPVVAKPVSLPICSTSTVKSWMDYRAIKDTNSEQYQLQNQAKTGVYGIRMVGEYMLVAMGNFYAKDTIGKTFKVELSGGATLLVMIGDVKSDAHTVNQCYTQHDGSVLEFIVDSKLMDKSAKYHGDFNRIFIGSITSIIEQ